MKYWKIYIVVILALSLIGFISSVFSDTYLGKQLAVVYALSFTAYSCVLIYAILIDNKKK